MCGEVMYSMGLQVAKKRSVKFLKKACITRDGNQNNTKRFALIIKIFLACRKKYFMIYSMRILKKFLKSLYYIFSTFCILPKKIVCMFIRGDVSHCEDTRDNCGAVCGLAFTFDQVHTVYIICIIVQHLNTITCAVHTNICISKNKSWRDLN